MATGFLPITFTHLTTICYMLYFIRSTLYAIRYTLYAIRNTLYEIQTQNQPLKTQKKRVKFSYDLVKPTVSLCKSYHKGLSRTWSYSNWQLPIEDDSHSLPGNDEIVRRKDTRIPQEM